jgi:hypothetical protein
MDKRIFRVVNDAKPARAKRHLFLAPRSLLVTMRRSEMNEAIDQVRSLLRQADEALARQLHPARTPKERDDDLAEAQRAHRHAAAILDTLRAQASADDGLVAALASLHMEAADLEILISEIRFDENERLPRLRHAEA